jgi:hypothetical protein
MTYLTIASATYRDDEGIWFTFTQLRHAIAELRQLVSDWSGDIELLVADNDPQAQANSRWLRAFCAASGIRYLLAHEVVGTAYPRDKAIREARGDFVLMLDSHVYVTAKSLAALVRYLTANQLTDDLLHGPLVYDSDPVAGAGERIAYDDCYVPKWRNEMLGISSRVWVCKCGKFYFCPWPDPVLVTERSVLRFWDATISDPVLQGKDGNVEWCPICGERLPAGMQFYGHERRLRELGYRPAIETEVESYPAPMLGMGLFCVRRESWLGFAPNGVQGFGGEEGLIHGLYRHVGRDVRIVRGLEWRHYFGQRHVRAPVRKIDKARNFVLMSKYACNRSVQDIYEHFVLGKDNALTTRLSEQEWQQIMAEAEQRKEQCVACAGANPQNAARQQITATAPTGQGQSVHIQVRLPPDVPQPMRAWLEQLARDTQSEKYRTLTDMLMHVPTISEAVRERRVWVAGRYADMLAAILAYSEPKPAQVFLLPGGEMAGIPLAGSEARIAKRDSVSTDEISDKDDLVLVRHHIYPPLQSLVADIAPRYARIIALQPEITYIPQGASEPKTDFAFDLQKLLSEHTEFTRAYYVKRNGGMAILTRIESEKKKPPPVWKLVHRYLAFKLWFWFRSLFAGKGYLSPAEARKRWQVCLLCEARFGERCGECGCYLRQFPNGALGRTWYRDQDCPLKKWPKPAE